ncbi:MAG: hypothetical protein AAGU75_19015, partial [Bacillota bacterium]
MSLESSLQARLENLSDQQLSAFTKSYTYNSSYEAVNIVLQYDAQITAAAERYGVPKELIQATIYREQLFLGPDDSVSDSSVFMYYTQGATLNKQDSSTGLGQIFAWVAIDAENAITGENILDKNNPNDIWTVWQNLQDPTYNIEHVTMNLKVIADKNEITDLYNATPTQLRDVLARYNGTGDAAIEHGNQVVEYLPIFEDYNSAIPENMLNWDTNLQIIASLYLSGESGGGPTATDIPRTDPNQYYLDITLQQGDGWDTLGERYGTLIERAVVTETGQGAYNEILPPETRITIQVTGEELATLFYSGDLRQGDQGYSVIGEGGYLSDTSSYFNEDITYQSIAANNGISNPHDIDVGQNVTIFEVPESTTNTFEGNVNPDLITQQQGAQDLHQQADQISSEGNALSGGGYTFTLDPNWLNYDQFINGGIDNTT